MRHIHSDESVGGRSTRHTPVRHPRPAHPLWDKARCVYVCKQSHSCCRSLTSFCRVLVHVMNLQILSSGCESVLRHHRARSALLSNPARTTSMTSAVKTKRVRISSSSSSSVPCPAAGPWRPALARGRSQESGLGGSRCLDRGKLNNFKVHLVKRPKTYFNTSFALCLTLSVGAPPLYVCLRQCERVKVCVILQCISILLHLCSQKVSR